MSLGPLRIGSIDLLQVSLESTAMLHAIALAHRLLMPWMGHRLADKFARQFALGRANSQVDDVDAVLPVAFAALALAALVHAASVTDAVGGAASAADAGASAEEEGGVGPSSMMLHAPCAARPLFPTLLLTFGSKDSRCCLLCEL